MNLINNYRNHINLTICQLNILVFVLLLMSGNLKAQENFKIGDFLTLYNNDSLVVTFNRMGHIRGKNASVSKFSKPIQCRVSGLLKNGKPHGKWDLYEIDLRKSLYSETFDNGKFISGKCFSLMGVDHYVDYPKIVLNTFYPNEAVDLSEAEDGYPTGDHILPLLQAYDFVSE